MPKTTHPRLDTRHDDADRRASPAKHRRRRDRFQRLSKTDVEKIVADVVELVETKVDPDPHRVGALYHAIIELMEDNELVPESAFDESSYNYQASWDEWGRGYQPEPRHLDAEGSPDEHDAAHKGPEIPASERQAEVLIERVATRQQAIKALKKLSHQGEAPHLGEHETGEPSHFDRFLEIYAELENLPKDFKPARNVPLNPTTRDPAGPHPSGKPAMGDATSAVERTSLPAVEESTFIEARRAQKYAELFNLRYRMLLTYLAHTFRLARLFPLNKPSVRAAVMHRAFGEMYNLKALANLLVRLPLRDGSDGRFAAPPFEMPYSLILSDKDDEIWRQHLALIVQSKELCDEILADRETPHGFRERAERVEAREYLATLTDLDRRAADWIGSVLKGVERGAAL
jgi:hypothetical protein